MGLACCAARTSRGRLLSLRQFLILVFGHFLNGRYRWLMPLLDQLKKAVALKHNKGRVLWRKGAGLNTWIQRLEIWEEGGRTL